MAGSVDYDDCILEFGIGQCKKSCYNDVSIINANTKETDGI